MIIYKTIKRRFIEEVNGPDSVAHQLRDAVRAHGMNPVNEMKSWVEGSLAMSKVLMYADIPDDATICLEYCIPFTTFRVDFSISGYDREGKPVLIIIELKGWDGKGLRVSNNGNEIKTDFYKDKPIQLHPSYQSWSYANYIRYFNSEASEGRIEVIPCVYMYNCSSERRNEVLEDPRYSVCVSKAPIFYYQDVRKMADLISSKISSSDGCRIIEDIDHGKLRIDSSLQKSLRRVLTENDYFAPMEDQVHVYNVLTEGARDGFEHRRKKVYIVKGGPGTGKSVLALKLLSEFNGGYDRGREHLHIPSIYVTKTSAPRKTYQKDLEWLAKRIREDTGSLSPLFSGASAFYGKESNSYPVLIVDEAHRLARKSFALMKGENQVKEIIGAALISIFFIDEHQNVSMADIGTEQEIRKWAREFNATVIDGLMLKTQFRCSGSDAYLKWLDHSLMIPTDGPYPTGDLGYKISVVDTIPELLEAIRSRRADGKTARVFAGYCWSWSSKGDKDGEKTDFNLDGVDLRWNSTTDTWANDDRLMDEVGCIHSGQGMEFQVCGVIIGDDLAFREGKVITQPEKRDDINGTLVNYQRDPARADLIIRNTYYTLMSRGQEECIIYCTDKPLAEYLKSCIPIPSKRSYNDSAPV